MLMKPYFDSDEILEIKKVLDSGWVAQGPKVREFEEGCSKVIGVKHAIAVTNGTAALHLAMLGLGIKKGDEVLVADYTFPATGHAVMYTGAKPVFVDINPLTYNIDPVKIEKKITRRTKAIIPVHTFGQSAEMDSILEIAEDHNLSVVEDAACAFGASYKGRKCGGMGNVGCFSFHARKGITTGEGGMVVTNDDELAATMRKLSIFGIESSWDRKDRFIIPVFDMLGYNYKMSDITAAVGVAQLRKLDEIINRKITLAKCWNSEIEDKIPIIAPPYVDTNSNHVYQSYVCLVSGPETRKLRNTLIEELTKKGIKALIGTYASHIQPIYKSKDKCPNSKFVFDRAIALPIHHDLTPDDIAYIVDVMREIVKSSYI